MDGGAESSGTGRGEGGGPGDGRGRADSRVEACRRVMFLCDPGLFTIEGWIVFDCVVNYPCMWIVRDYVPILRQLGSQYPVVVLTGPRQIGKTALLQKGFSN